jgi:hypothetical protein
MMHSLVHELEQIELAGPVERLSSNLVSHQAHADPFQAHSRICSAGLRVASRRSKGAREVKTPQATLTPENGGLPGRAVS